MGDTKAQKILELMEATLLMQLVLDSTDGLQTCQELIRQARQAEPAPGHFAAVIGSVAARETLGQTGNFLLPAAIVDALKWYLGERAKIAGTASTWLAAAAAAAPAGMPTVAQLTPFLAHNFDAIILVPATGVNTACAHVRTAVEQVAVALRGDWVRAWWRVEVRVQAPGVDEMTIGQGSSAAKIFFTPLDRPMQDAGRRLILAQTRDRRTASRVRRTTGGGGGGGGGGREAGA